MSVNKHKVLIDCKNCVFKSSVKTSGFEVSVPVCDLITGTRIDATLHCSVSPQQHQVELLDWHDDEHGLTSLPEDLQQRISATIDFVAGHRICGNEAICPSEVVQIVTRLSSK